MLAVGSLSIKERIFLSLLPSLLLFSRGTADITVSLCGLFFLWLSYQHKDWSWAKTSWFKWVWVFWGYLLLINVPLSIDPSDSLFYAITFIRWPLFAAAIAYWMLKDKPRQQWFLITLILTSLFIVLDTVWQYLTGVDWFGMPSFTDTRLTGPFRNPIPGTMMVRVWFIMLFAVFLMPLLTSQKRQLFYLIALIALGLGFIFITGERMAFIVFLAGSAVCITGMFFEYQAHRKQLLIGFFAIAIGFIILSQLNPMMTQRTISSALDKLAHFSESDYGQVFQTAVSAWQQHPVFGSGLHTYRTVCEGIALSTQANLNCSHPHNLYLHIAAETGLFGLCLFVIMLLMLYFNVLRPLYRSQQWLKMAASFTILSASLWPLIGGKSVLNNWVAALVWLGVGWCLAMSLAHKKQASN